MSDVLSDPAWGDEHAPGTHLESLSPHPFEPFEGARLTRSCLCGEMGSRQKHLGMTHGRLHQSIIIFQVFKRVAYALAWWKKKQQC